jgi:hypothetical protein
MKTAKFNGIESNGMMLVNNYEDNIVAARIPAKEVQPDSRIR